MPDLIKELNVHSQDETAELAKNIAAIVKNGDVITLRGGLGAGKTFFARSLIRSLCKSDVEVNSPTFNLLQTYSAEGFEIWHFDLYRLKTPQEIIELGLDESLNSCVTVIEWPEIIGHLLPESRIDIEISFEKEENNRVFKFYSSENNHARVKEAIDGGKKRRRA